MKRSAPSRATPWRAALVALPVLFGLAACGGGGDDSDAVVSTANLPPAPVMYQNGIAQLQKNEPKKAAKTFQSIEENYPYSTWANHAQLLDGYAQYIQQNYDDAIAALNRYIQLHPNGDETAYAYYLKALCYYEQIEDIQRDQTNTLSAIGSLNDVITRYPDTVYARDARVKLRLATNRLAGHEMAIGKFYEQQNLTAAAIGRYQNVINTYQTTTYVPEALERLTEVYLRLGLVDAARRTASVLAYNYPGSRWYVAAYNKFKANGLLLPGNGKLVPGADAADAEPAVPDQSGAAGIPPELNGHAPQPQPPARKKSGGFFFGLF